MQFHVIWEDTLARLRDPADWNQARPRENCTRVKFSFQDSELGLLL